jgi:hypothetical protein
MKPRWNVSFLLKDPEIRNLAAQSDDAREPHYFLVTQWRESFLIPLDKRFEMLFRGGDGDMVNIAGRHGCWLFEDKLGYS